jgi:NADPH:quinone reductase-like Zn-dependent oxidoreductase
MRALHAYARNDANRLVYEDAPSPEISPGDVLIRVKASGVSPSELAWPTTWISPDGSDRPLPIIPGHEVSGIVEARGSDVGHPNIGDEVYGLIDFQRNGSNAELVAARAAELAPKPSTIDHVQTAAIPLSGLTAWQALFDHAHLKSGQRVLIHGGAGGVGSLAVQLAHWCGAYVIATASGADADIVRSLGANDVINYRDEQFDSIVSNVDVVFDTVGAETWHRSWPVLRPGGTIVSVAVPRPPIESAPDTIQAVWFVVASNPDQLTEIASLIDADHLRPIVAEVLPLSRGPEAYASSTRARPGKIVLDIAGHSAAFGSWKG